MTGHVSLPAKRLKGQQDSDSFPSVWFKNFLTAKLIPGEGRIETSSGSDNLGEMKPHIENTQYLPR